MEFDLSYGVTKITIKGFHILKIFEFLIDFNSRIQAVNSSKEIFTKSVPQQRNKAAQKNPIFHYPKET